MLEVPTGSLLTCCVALASIQAEAEDFQLEEADVMVAEVNTAPLVDSHYRLDRYCATLVSLRSPAWAAGIALAFMRGSGRSACSKLQKDLPCQLSCATSAPRLRT